jgi:tetratricopeptide (TPR) repeat protein
MSLKEKVFSPEWHKVEKRLVSLLKEERFEEALVECKRSYQRLRRRKKMPDLEKEAIAYNSLMMKGLLNYFLGRYKTALRYYQEISSRKWSKGIIQNPLAPKLLQTDIYIASKRPEKALEMLENIIKEKNKDSLYLSTPIFLSKLRSIYGELKQPIPYKKEYIKLICDCITMIHHSILESETNLLKKEPFLLKGLIDHLCSIFEEFREAEISQYHQKENDKRDQTEKKMLYPTSYQNTHFL